MKIGFDAKRLFSNYTGLGNYSRTLVENVQECFPEHQYALFAKRLQENARTKPFFSEQFQIVQPNSKLPIAWRSVGMAKAIQQQNVDVFHGLSAELPLGLKTPSVVTIHDLIFETQPQQYKPIDRLIYRAKAKYACQQASKVIAISEATKQDIIRFYGIDEQKIEVVYQTCDEQFYQPIAEEHLAKAKTEYNLPEQYLLYVGSVIERKNLLQIVKALALTDCPPLVVIGDTSSAYAQKVLHYVEEKKLQEKMQFIQPKFSDFSAIYKGAELFLYPSEYEGFGIPVVEALAVGTPVITSNCSSLPEAGGPHSVLLNEISPQEIALQIKRLLQNGQLRETMVEQGKQYVQQFNAQRLSEQLMSVYEQVR